MFDWQKLKPIGCLEFGSQFFLGGMVTNLQRQRLKELLYRTEILRNIGDYFLAIEILYRHENISLALILFMICTIAISSDIISRTQQLIGCK